MVLIVKKIIKSQNLMVKYTQEKLETTFWFTKQRLLKHIENIMVSFKITVHLLCVNKKKKLSKKSTFLSKIFISTIHQINGEIF